MNIENINEHQESADAPLQFPVKISSALVPAHEILVESDLLPETLLLISNAKLMLHEKRELTISDIASYEVAAEQLGKIKAAGKTIDEKRKLLTNPLKDESSRIIDSVRPYVDALIDAEKIIKNAMVAYNDAQEQKRLLEEAEAERKRKVEEEKLLEKANKAEEKGHTEKADALREIAASTVMAAPAISVPTKVSGVSSKKTYSAEVTDLKALVAAVAAGTVPIQALQADMTFLNKMAVAFKDDFDYAGCKLSTSTSIAVRSKK